MDNRYYNYNCPPLMNDGRFISSYVRSSTFDQYVRNINNINSSHEYRHYLQNNGTEIMNNIKAYLRQNNTCSVEGKCLPMSGPITPIVQKPVPKQQWYEELLDEEPSQLDFMMHVNEPNNNNVIQHLQPTFNIKKNVSFNNASAEEDDEEECTSCKRN
jgi:hypothetical protein